MKFYTIETLAELLQTDESTVLALSIAGQIPEPVFIGGRIVRWPECAIDDWAIEGCEQERPTLGESEWIDIRQANRCEFLSKHLAEEELNRAAVASCTSTADKAIGADAVAGCRQCNKTND